MKKFSIISIAILLFFIIGYVKGLVKFVQCDFKSPYKAEVIYGIGTFTGLGTIIGWIDIPDGEAINKKENENISK